MLTLARRRSWTYNFPMRAPSPRRAVLAALALAAAVPCPRAQAGAVAARSSASTRLPAGAAAQWSAQLTAYFASSQPRLSAVMPTLKALGAVDLSDPEVRAQLQDVAAAAETAATLRLAQGPRIESARQDELLASAEQWRVLSEALGPLLSEPSRAKVSAARARHETRLNAENRARLDQRMRSIASALGTPAAEEALPAAAREWPGAHGPRNLPAAWRLQPSTRKTAPSDPVLDAFARMPAAFKTAIQGLYADPTVLGRHDHLPHSGERLYGLRWEKGEEHARALIKLGYETAKDESGLTILKPPSDMATTFSLYERRMRELLASGAASEERLLRPALPFARRDGGGYVFVRPGIDPWPSPADYEVAAELKTVPLELFFTVVGQGKMPIALRGRMFQHELAHLTEFYEHPELMALTRSHAPMGAAEGEWSGTPPQVRTTILGEFLSLPDVRKAADIRALLPHWFDPATPPTPVEAQRRLLSLPSAERQRHIEALVDRGEELLLRHGGGFRDYYNTHLQYPDKAVLEEAAHFLARPGQRWTTRDNPMPRESLHGVLRELEVLRDLRYRPDSFAGRSPDVAATAAALLKGPDVEAGLDARLAERLARFEAALHAAVDLELTPEQIYRDARLSRPRRDSATSRYFARVAERGEALYYAFVGDAR